MQNIFDLRLVLNVTSFHLSLQIQLHHYKILGLANLTAFVIIMKHYFVKKHLS